MPSGSDYNLQNPGTGSKDAYLAYKYAIQDQMNKQAAEAAQDQNRPASTALNVAALMDAAETAPEANPRNTSGEILSNIYRELGRLRGDVSYLKQR